MMPGTANSSSGSNSTANGDFKKALIKQLKSTA